MELTLLGTVALLAFLVGGAMVMLVSAFRRTIELRGALLQALRRIEALEAVVATGDLTRLPSAARHAAVANDTTASLPPRPELAIAGPAPRPATHVDDAMLQVEANDRIDPPRPPLVAAVASLAALAALAAAQLQALSTQAGVFLAVAAGLSTIALAEWRRRHVHASGGPSDDRGASLTALLGVALVFAALMCGRWIFDALQPAGIAFATGALATGAAIVSTRHGPTLLAGAIAIGAIAPAQSPIGAPGAWGQYAFLLGFTAMVMELSRRREEAIWAWAAAIVALFWGANAVAIGGAPFNIGAAGLYLAGLAALGLFYAWPWGDAPAFPRLWDQGWNEPLLFGHGLVGLTAATLCALLIAHPTPVVFAGAAMIAFVAITIAAGALQHGLWRAPSAAALAVALIIASWPPTGVVAEAAGLLVVASSLALLFAIGGAAAMAGAADPRPGGWLAALAPVAIFAAAYARMSDFAAANLWSAAGFLLGAINAVAYMQLQRRKSPAAPAFATGAVLACATALAALMPTPFQPFGIALGLTLCAFVDQKLNEPGLRYAAWVLCIAAYLTLLTPQIMLTTAIAPTQVAALFGLCGFACFGASVLFARQGRPNFTSKGALSTALVIIATGVTLLARHFYTEGDLLAPYMDLAEAALNTLIWLGLALVLAWRLGPRPAPLLHAVELVIFAGAAFHALIVTGIWINPWWGPAPAPMSSANALGSLELAYLAPATLAFAYALLRERHRLEARAGAAFAFGFIMLFVALVLEVRRLFHGAELAHAPILAAEAWTYSLTTLGFAALLLAVGVDRGLKWLRHASFSLAVAALAKMAFLDSGSLDGFGRLAAALALVGAIACVVYLYRRFISPLNLGAAKPIVEANPISPG